MRACPVGSLIKAEPPVERQHRQPVDDRPACQCRLFHTAVQDGRHGVRQHLIGLSLPFVAQIHHPAISKHQAEKRRARPGEADIGKTLLNQPPARRRPACLAAAGC